MSSQGENLRRVQFFGADDLATGYYILRVAAIVEEFDPSKASWAVMDVLELHNVQKYLEHGFLPLDYTELQRAEATTRIGPIRSTVARFFSLVDNDNCASLIEGVGYEYHSDLLELLGRNRAFDRCDAATMLHALNQTGVHLYELLGCKKLVSTYDLEVRDLLLASPPNAEQLIRKHLEKDVRKDIHLPRSLTRSDMRGLLERYIDCSEANPNYVRLIESAPIGLNTGIDAKLKLRAKRRNAEMTEKLFEENSGFKTGTEVSLSETQYEPVHLEIDDSEGFIVRITYSKRWFDETTDNPSILNNFQLLFEFTNGQVLLSLPSYKAQLGSIEKAIGVTGKSHYQTGVKFNSIGASSLLQTRLYHHYLENNGKDLEEVISWFFEEYIAEEFDAQNFSFVPSSGGASYIERLRHLFAEMESVAAQFSLWVENEEVDSELLSITSDPIRYRDIPSLLPGKYVYPIPDSDITDILPALFSDQSGLAYISSEVRGRNASELIMKNEVSYDHFREHQKPAIDQLIAFGILINDGVRIRIANAQQFLILRSLFMTEACSYYHLPVAGREEVNSMVDRGWVERRSTLLTDAEGRYFNFFLNKVDFSNGPELRNKYLHGTQRNGDGEGTHFQDYVIALRLMIALVIKLNDDFCLAAEEKLNSEDSKNSS